MPARTQTKLSQKLEKLKQSNKINKNILIAKSLEALTNKAKFDPIIYTSFKSMRETETIIFVEIGRVLYLKDLIKTQWLLKID